jgi:D-inositol-3-phosphate glycosyltransferase
VRRLAVLSFHTSPLAQPGAGDGGGMNVYVLQLSTALARAGVHCDVYTRAWSEGVPPSVVVEPGLAVHHIPAGPLEPVPKEALADLAEEFTAGVLARMGAGGEGCVPDAVHANYWLSGLAGHVIKHELEVPLVSTFHTLDRVKAEASMAEVVASEPARRAEAEAEIIACSDAVLASCAAEADQLIQLYEAPPERIELVAPGVDHAFFAPGDRAQARRAVGLREGGHLLAFVGRIQPLKGAEVAVRALAVVRRVLPAELVVIGGPSGPQGEAELSRLRSMVGELGLGEAVHFVEPQPHELLSTWYRAMDVCLVPSRSESFGLVALEAAACGVPVVASAVGGLLSLVDHGVTGYLVEGREPASFASRAVQVLTDPDLGLALSRQAAARARRYSWSEAAAQLLELYDRLTARRLVACD